MDHATLESGRAERGPRDGAARSRAVAAQTRRDLAAVDHELRAFVRERPLASLLGALAFGYLAGRMLARR
jgi:hypothetical protein